jgi:hypothetical protein
MGVFHEFESLEFRSFVFSGSFLFALEMIENEES